MLHSVGIGGGGGGEFSCVITNYQKSNWFASHTVVTMERGGVAWFSVTSDVTWVSSSLGME